MVRSRLPRFLAVSVTALLLAVVGWLVLGSQDDRRAPEPRPGRSESRGTAPTSQPEVVPAVVEPLAVGDVPPSSTRSIPEERTSSTGSLVVEVRDSLERPVGAGTVQLVRGSGHGPVQREVSVDGQGDALFEGLERGTWRPTLVPESLPPGYAPPWVRETELPPPFGFEGVHAEVAAGGVTRLRLTVVTAAVIDGFVYGPRGEGVEGAWVRVSTSVPRARYLTFSVQSDETGYWRAEGIHPETYEVKLSFEEGHPSRGLSRPRPVVLDVGPGARIRHDLLLGRGRHTVSGRVLDQDGEPLAGAAVILVYDGEYNNWTHAAGKAESGVDGRFAMHGIPTDRVRLILLAPPSEVEYPSRISRSELVPIRQALDLDLSRAGDVVDVGDQTVHQVRPFFLEGRVVMSPDWIEQHGERLPSIRVELTQPEEAAMAPNDRIRRWPQRMSADAEGRFTWACQTPHRPVVVTVTARGRVVSESVVQPEPLVTHPLEVTLP